ncbi:MAG: hypothetical protein Q4B30_03310 [Coriobacteriaceae bacterium]|nr:hypothetical protein [Coriobacteriaceae bacterium]
MTTRSSERGASSSGRARAIAQLESRLADICDDAEFIRGNVLMLKSTENIEMAVEFIDMAKENGLEIDATRITRLAVVLRDRIEDD